MEPLKACVPGGVNYPLKPVTPGYQDAALTEVKMPNVGPNPLKALLYTRKLTGITCVHQKQTHTQEQVYWQFNDKQKLTMDSGIKSSHLNLLWNGED